MTAHTHPDNALFRALTRPLIAAQDIARDQTEAVATATGCPNWTSPEGCDGITRDPRYECYCATAAKAVALIERTAGRAS